MITKNLYEKILLHPVNHGADSLLVVSGYASSAMVNDHIERVAKETGKSISIRLVVGMAGKDGISKANHLAFQRLSTIDFPSQFECHYVSTLPPVHSKVYVWLKEDVPIEAFVGSPNYSQNAFSSQAEAAVSSDPAQGLEYFKKILKGALKCSDSKANKLLGLYCPAVRPSPLGGQSVSSLGMKAGIPNLSLLPKVCVSFLARDGSLPQISGLNWGQRTGREPNQAYLRLPSSVYRESFFPSIGKHFTVLTDDNEVLYCVRAQQNGKAIHTYQNNSQLGLYFRRRLKLEAGVPVQKSDLVRYGRDDVCFYKIDDETFFMDFS